MMSSYPLKVWKQVFETFRQVERCQDLFDNDLLKIKIEGKSELLEATLEELDDTLYKFNGNPREVAAHFLKRYGVIVYYQNTLVAFFDIIGYSTFLETATEFQTCIHRLEPFIQSCGTSGTDCMALKLDHWILSDSVIVVVDTNRSPLFLQSLQIFFGTCSQIMANSMKLGFPLRGAVGGGDFYKDAELMVSSGLVDAAKYEKEQEWLGAVITPKALRMIEIAKKDAPVDMPIDLTSSFTRHIAFGPIPWKSSGRDIDKPEQTYFIKPRMADPDWSSKYLPDYFNDDNKVANSHRLYSHSA